MPELSEVEVVRRNLALWWTRPADAVLLHDAKLLTRGDVATLVELLSTSVPTMLRRGKYLIASFEDGHAVVFHFRMTGKIVCDPDPAPRFARLAWDGSSDGWLVFKDSRRLGHVDLFAPGELTDYKPLATMGPEPHDLDGAGLEARLSPRRRLKDALLDQSVIAGVGNIAVSEVFWRLQLPPDIGVGAMSPSQIDALAVELPRYFDALTEAEMSDEIAYVNEGGAENPFDVYGREGQPCPRCGSSIDRLTVGGRSSYFCPACQT